LKLSQLIENIKEIEIIRLKDTEITGITEDSRDIKPGYLFFAIKGFQTDGHKFINDAIKKGSVVIIGTDRKSLTKIRSHKNISIIRAKNIRKITGFISHKFFNEPSKKLKLIGITGTNGKTTTSFIIYNVLKKLNIKAGLIGSIYYITPSGKEKADRTTPPPVKLNQLLKKIVKEDGEYGIMEVSSHSILLHRIEGLEFYGGVFTNLSPEHLDFHNNMYNYFLAKYQLTNYINNNGIFAVNTDDPFGKILYGLKNVQCFRTESFGKNGNLKILDVKTANRFSAIQLLTTHGKMKIETNLKGMFNAYNIAAAVSILLNMELPPQLIETAFKNIQVPGRFEEIAPKIFIDYAHTPDALKKILKTLRELYPKDKLTLVFGCGGDRDRNKRPLMGKIASVYADRIIVTDDNPRFENPERIISEILIGCDPSKTITIRDRKTAIVTALKEKRNGVVIIAGKGPDEYQEIEGIKYPFSDKESVLGVINDNP